MGKFSPGTWQTWFQAPDQHLPAGSVALFWETEAQEREAAHPEKWRGPQAETEFRPV